MLLSASSIDIPIFKIFEQRTSAPSKFESWFGPCKHAIHGEKLTCMHLRFGMKLSQWNIWLTISGQSNCIDHKITFFFFEKLKWGLYGYIIPLSREPVPGSA